MIFHDGRGLAISASPSGLKDVADHLNWLATGSMNRDASMLYPETKKPYSSKDRLITCKCCKLVFT